MGWQLEVGKMVMYMAFPVAAFYIFNQPQIFEEWVIKTRRECFPPASVQGREELRAAIAKVREAEARKLRKELEELER